MGKNIPVFMVCGTFLKLEFFIPNFHAILSLEMLLASAQRETSV
jgi:hypothetical protein